MRYLSFFLFLAPTLFLANDRLFNRLNHLYQEKPEKCLHIAKKQIAKNSRISAPYYFASRIYFDKFQSSNTLSKKYSSLGRSIYYGMAFEKRKDQQLQSRVKWADFKKDLLYQSNSLVAELQSESLKEKATKLIVKLEKFNGKKPNVIDRKRTPSIPHVKPEIASTFKNGQYFGMPSGNERIPSANLQGEKQLLAILNKARKEKGMSELVWEENLANAARYHAFDLATQKYFDHKTFDRTNNDLTEVGGTFVRIKKFYKTSFINSENIAAGNASPEITYNQWYNSPGHYNNMFNKSSKKVGIGVYYDKNSPYGYYWVFCTAL